MKLPDLAIYNTLPKLLSYNAANHGAELAFREKTLGIWREMTWQDVHQRTLLFTLGLIDLGVTRGDVVGILGDNRPDWIIAEVASQAAGAMSLGLYRDALDEEVAYLINYAGVNIVFAEDEEQVDKLLSLGPRVSTLTNIIYCDPRGMRKYNDPRLLPASELIRRGAELHRQSPSRYSDMVERTCEKDTAILCTTSGTTSNPKLAMLPAGRLLRHCASYLKVDPRNARDEYVSVLPLSWIMEQVYAVGMSFLTRMRVNFVEEPETMLADFREIAPSFVLFAPRLWEQIAADVRARMMESTPFKRVLYALAMRFGKAAHARGHCSWIADVTLFRALRDRLGFTRLRSAATGGAALGPDTFSFFQIMGVPLRQLYGQTESMGAYTVHRAGEVDFETVGVPFDEGVELRILQPDKHGVGEIAVRHANMFTGYFRRGDPIDPGFESGWMRTGDAGYLNAKGHLVVIDRINDLAITANAERFSPQYIENKLKFSPYIAEVVSIGHDRPYLTAIICIRFQIVSKWAEHQGIAFTTLADLASRPQVRALIRREVEQVNSSLPQPQRISKFVLLYKDLDADDGELTRTKKIKRGVIVERYGDIIAAMYSGQAEIKIDTSVTFQDGASQRIRTILFVETLIPSRPDRSEVSQETNQTSWVEHV